MSKKLCSSMPIPQENRETKRMPIYLTKFLKQVITFEVYHFSFLLVEEYL